MSGTTTHNEVRCLDIAQGALDLVTAADWLQDRIEHIRPDSVSKHATKNGISVQCTEADTMARATRTLMAGAPVGSITKTIEGDDEMGWVRVRREFGTAFVEAWIVRDEVCIRVVTGTETVEVPDPAAPKVTVERDVVEWRCGSILGGAA